MWSATGNGSAPRNPDDRLGLLVEQLTARRDRQRRAADRAAADLADFARTGRAPRELRAVQQRIDRGELCWAEVVGTGPAAPDARSDVDAVRELWRVPLSGLPRALADARTRMERDGLDPAEAARLGHPATTHGDHG